MGSNAASQSKLHKMWKDLNYRHGNSVWMGALKKLKDSCTKKNREDDKKELANMIKSMGFSDAKIEYIEHHVCHANTPLCFFGEPDKPFLILTLDGSGDKYCASVNK